MSKAKEIPTIAWFVSGHGLGHAARATHAMEHVAPDRARLLVFTLADPEFIRREAKRPVDVIPRAWDHGPVQASNFAIDWEESFAKCRAVQRRAEQEADELAAILIREKVRAVVCDIAPFPLRVARRLGIPAALIANFTWCDVLADEAAGHADREALLAAYRADYATAHLTLRTPMSFPLRGLPNRLDIDLIARRATRIRREELRRAAGAKSGERVVPVYLGLWGTGDLRLLRAARVPGVRFVGYRPVGDLLTVISSDDWPFEELVASSDALLCKPGYGALAACQVNAIPCVYYPRPEFSEYYRLRAGVDAWGGGVRMTTRELMAGRWDRALEQAFALRPSKASADGGRQAVEAVFRMMNK